MRMPDEIKKGLECCAEYGNCSNGCPYNPIKDCGAALYSDALDYIQQLERERDAAVEGLEAARTCPTCGYYELQGYDCMRCSNSISHPHWKWRGVQKEVE